MGKYVIVFLTMLMAFFGAFSAKTDITTTANQENARYTQYLSSATYDASSQMSEEAEEGVMMPTTESRQRVVNTFFNSLALNFGYDTDEDIQRLKAYVPVVAMIDTDGYYICYNIAAKNANGAVELHHAITPINTWAETYDGVTVRYYLGNKVEVISKDQSTVRNGNYSDVLQWFVDKGSAQAATTNILKSHFSFDDKKKFITYRNSVIIPKMQDTIEYYINKQNKVAADVQPNYIWEMPTTKTDDWVRVLENPTCIAFLQGIRQTNAEHYLNIYSLGGGEVKLTNGVFYTDNEGTNDREYSEINGSNKTGYVTSQQQAAQAGGNMSDYANGDAAKDQENQEKKENASDAMLSELVEHHHWFTAGNLVRLDSAGHYGANAGQDVWQGTTAGNGCYTSPLYHQHNDTCYGDVTVKQKHEHTDACYADRYHGAHKMPSGGAITKNGNCTKKGGCYTIERTENINGTNTIVYAPSCGYWQLTHKFTVEQCIANSSEYQTAIQYLPDYRKTYLTMENVKASIKALNPAATPSDEQLKATLQTRIDEAIKKSIEGKDLTCGKTEGELYDVTLHTTVCGKYEPGERLRDASYNYIIENGTYKTSSGTIDGYKLGCGLNEGEKITKKQAETKNRH